MQRKTQRQFLRVVIFGKAEKKYLTGQNLYCGLFSTRTNLPLAASNTLSDNSRCPNMIRPSQKNFDLAFSIAITLFFLSRSSHAANPSPARPLPTAYYKRDIQPIFEKRCYECHSDKKQKGGLRLDKKASVLQGGDSGKPVVFAGKSGESLLFKKITSTDPDEKMPPKGERLTEHEVTKIRDWIERGAIWPDDAEKKHWAYEKPLRPELPSVKNKKTSKGGKGRKASF